MHYRYIEDPGFQVQECQANIHSSGDLGHDFHHLDIVHGAKFNYKNVVDQQGDTNPFKDNNLYINIHT